ncbi:MAG: hypothetical protein FJX57_04330, partial [Alphaproteobacteria bacterium]|nr:hypothetical protein [Alphaproteobacteria bacterium]
MPEAVDAVGSLGACGRHDPGRQHQQDRGKRSRHPSRPHSIPSSAQTGEVCASDPRGFRGVPHHGCATSTDAAFDVARDSPGFRVAVARDSLVAVHHGGRSTMSTWTRARVALPEGQGFDRCTLDSGRPGLRVVVFGGTHGDETEGVLAANRLVARDLALRAGVLEVVPIVHEAAYVSDTRVSPLDGGNLARLFPGDPAGSPTARLAHALQSRVIAGADLLIDLHTAGQIYDIPFLAGYIDDGRDRKGLGARAASVFGADFIWRHEARPAGRTISDVDAAI